MTAYLVDSEVTTNATSADAQDMTNSGDTLLVTASGSLIALGLNSDGINASNDSQTITLNGLAYSAVDDGVVLSGDDSQIFVNGAAEGPGGIGVDATGTGDSVYVNGTAQGGNTGVVLAGPHDALYVNGLVEGGTGIAMGADLQALNIGASGQI